MLDKHDPSAKHKKVVRASAHSQGRYDNRVAVRDFGFAIAEPEKLGGTNAAPTPMEYVAGALNGCLSIVIEMVAREQNFALSGIEVESEGLVDQRGLFGLADVSPHFQEVDIKVRFRTEEVPDRVETLKTEVLKRCPVYNLIRDSGATVRVDWAAQPKE